MTGPKQLPRRALGKYARNLVQIAIFVNFFGVGLLGWAMFWTIAQTMTNPMIIAGLSYVFSPAIKALIGMFAPSFGLIFLAGQRKKIAAIFFVILGILTIIPMILGGFIMLASILDVWGVLPFLPHIIGGALLICAGILSALWQPEPITEGIEATRLVAETIPPTPDEHSPRCSYCGHGLFGDEQYCPGCGKELKNND